MTPTRRCQPFLRETARTDAHPAADVNGHSGGALAEEGARRVDALAVDANSGKDLALVDVWYQRPRRSLTRLVTRLDRPTGSRRRHGGLTFAEVPSDSGEAFSADGI